MAVALKDNALITAVELDEMLRVTIGDADLSNTLINIASDFIDQYANRSFISATYTAEKYDGNSDRRIYLKQYPIISVTTLASWDTISDIVMTTYTANTDYLLYLKEGYIYFRYKTMPGHQNYRVTYTAGYLIADVPYDLKNACAQLAGMIYNNTGKAGMKSEGIGQYSYTIKDGTVLFGGIPVPADIAGVILQYRNINV